MAVLYGRIPNHLFRVCLQALADISDRSPRSFNSIIGSRSEGFKHRALESGPYTNTL